MSELRCQKNNHRRHTTFGWYKPWGYKRLSSRDDERDL